MAKKASLEEYRKKRRFEVTPEPPPGRTAPREGAPRFMVHKHDATRLHYDLRLEMDGALASWAIPKGPSYDPAQKRLAVQTEDHPLEYGNFEGRIPEGEYGAGDSIIWDRGTYDTVPPGQASAQRKKGHLHIRLEGEKLEGEWHLVRTRPLGGKAQWLCFKAKDGTEDAGYDVVAERPESVATGRRVTRGPLRRSVVDAPHPVPEKLLEKVWPPMKAQLSRAEEAPAGEYLYEVKYDGYRALAAVSNGRVAFLSRNALDFSARFPEIARALGRLHVAEAVLDGEVVALDPRGNSSFQRIGDPRAEHRFELFDLLWLDGEDLRERPLEERRELLESVLANVPLPLEPAERIEGEAEDALGEARRRGLEGVIAKARGSRYEGRRSRCWQKLKVTGSQELAVLGFTPIKTGTKEIGALLVGVREGGSYVYAGKVGTGFDAKLRRSLSQRLEPTVVDAPPAKDAPRVKSARWVEPKLVAQVKFTEWTTDGKLRHPVFEGLREDKRPEDCVREQPQPTTGRKTGAERRATGTRRAPARLAARTARASDASGKSGETERTDRRSSRGAADTAGRSTRRRSSSEHGAARKRRASGPGQSASERSRRTATSPGSMTERERNDSARDAPRSGRSTAHRVSPGRRGAASAEETSAPGRQPRRRARRAGDRDSAPGTSTGAVRAIDRGPGPPMVAPVTIALSHPEKVLFPKSRITKGELFAYYEQVAPYLVRALEGRPLALQQWPKGIAHPGFFHQRAEHVPEWATTVEVGHERRPLRHWVVDRPETLLHLANHNAITLHMWNSRTPHLDEPDWAVFDLDPGKGHFSDLVTLAQALRRFLEQLGLTSVPKTSGQRGLHVLVPVARGHTHQDALDFAVAITEVLARKFPAIATTDRALSRRKGRLYLDAFQNGRGKTIVAPYSVRAVEGAPVSTPLRWDEVDDALDPAAFTVRTLPARLEQVGDLFAPALKGRQRLPRLSPR